MKHVSLDPASLEQARNVLIRTKNSQHMDPLARGSHILSHSIGFILQVQTAVYNGDIF